MIMAERLIVSTRRAADADKPVRLL